MESAERLKKIPPYLFMELRQKIGRARAAGMDVISLAIGDPVEPTPGCGDRGARRGRRATPRTTSTRPTKRRACSASARPWPAGTRERYGVTVDPQTEVLGADRLEGGLPPLRAGAGEPGRRRPDDRSRLSGLSRQHPDRRRRAGERADPAGARLPAGAARHPVRRRASAPRRCSSTTRTTRPAPSRRPRSCASWSSSRAATTSPSATTIRTSRWSSTARSR